MKRVNKGDTRSLDNGSCVKHDQHMCSLTYA